MSNLKLILEVNEDGKLVLPFSRRVLNLPQIKSCGQLRDLVVQQGNNIVWFYTAKYDRIRFETTERELNKIYDQYATMKSNESKNYEAVISLDSDYVATKNEDDDINDMQWIID